MGKKSAEHSSLGRALIKNRFRGQHGQRMVAGNSMLHTTELNDGSKVKVNYQSVTEESELEELLYRAKMADTCFQTETEDIKVINLLTSSGLLSDIEYEQANKAHEKFKECLKIPRRPAWTPSMSTAELDQIENESFWQWRKSLSELQEDRGLLLTPYEKNLEFWRQLWRVVEKSDVLVQIVDARNPLLFRCEDLEKYVKEVSEHKINMVLVNKADFLSDRQRQTWAYYFRSIGVRAEFFSSLEPAENSAPVKESEKSPQVDPDNTIKENVRKGINELEDSVEENDLALSKLLSEIEDLLHNSKLKSDVENCIDRDSRVLSRDELIDVFRTMHVGPKVTEGITTIGLVGYPNVGKSSTINSLLMAKKVSVSATPGKTKHFQTFYLDKDIVLCDCPGLVMPSFVFTKADMILNGILPIDEMRDHVPPANLVAKLIPRHVMEDKYGIMLPAPLEHEDPKRCPTAAELLNVYAYNRGYMTARGQPDNARAARYVLKDYTNGKLLYCYAPPSVDQSTFNSYPERQKTKLVNRVAPPREARAVRTLDVTGEDIDKDFKIFARPQAHSKGVATDATNFSTQSQCSDSINGKPWKEFNKHRNKGKKEKARRKYAHLDQH